MLDCATFERNCIYIRGHFLTCAYVHKMGNCNRACCRSYCKRWGPSAMTQGYSGMALSKGRGEEDDEEDEEEVGVVVGGMGFTGA
jgi:hypothetical protein